MIKNEYEFTFMVGEPTIGEGTAIKASGTTDDTVMLATLKLICAVCSKNTERFA